jgi:hypothetical protein
MDTPKEKSPGPEPKSEKPRRFIRFDFPRDATAKQIAEGLERLRAQYPQRPKSG